METYVHTAGFLAFRGALRGGAACRDHVAVRGTAVQHIFTMVQKAFCAKPVCYLLPVIAVLPWSDSFLREWKSGYLKAVLPRIGRRAYVEIKILTVAGGGILAVWLAAIVVTFGSFLVCFPQEKAGGIAAEPVQMLAATVLRCSLVGASFASLGGICGILGGSADMAFGIPLVVYYFCMILKERYFPDALWLYPPQWISGAARWGGTWGKVCGSFFC